MDVDLHGRNCEYAQQVAARPDGLAALFSAATGCGPLDQPSLAALLALATHGEEAEQMRDPQPVQLLLRWLAETEYEDGELQAWLYSRLLHLCTSSIQSRALCCSAGLLQV